MLVRVLTAVIVVRSPSVSPRASLAGAMSTGRATHQATLLDHSPV